MRRSARSRPRNDATNSLAGARSSSAGRSYCSRTPPTSRMAIRSASLMASSMSWVTKHDGLAQPALQVEQLVLEAGPDDRVDGAVGLVHQQHRRVGGQGPGDADALLLAAGQLGRVAAEQLGVEPDQVDELVDPGLGSGPCPSRGAAARWRCCRRSVRCGNRPVCWIT